MAKRMKMIQRLSHRPILNKKMAVALVMVRVVTKISQIRLNTRSSWRD